eukprot:m.55578 g.55578  ORF g.55578 m.55578 type:complete len:436 (+) comp11973_c0_seq3:61-1368(+)
MVSSFKLSLLAGMLLVCLSLVQAEQPPIILIPGFTSSNLFIRRTNFRSQYPFCKNTTGWGLLWPLEKFDFKNIDTILCWLESMQTVFNAANDTFESPPGVEVTTFDFGGKYGSGLSAIFKYFEDQGWKTGKTLFSAPFDWRVPSLGMSHFFGQLQSLVEKVRKDTGQRVVLLACSFGPQVTLSFLHRMTQQWKDEHIAWFVAESPVWSGAPLSVMSVISGLLVPNMTGFYRQIALRIPAIQWLFPRPGTNSSTTWTEADVLVRTPTRNYTAFDYDALFTDLGLNFFLPQLRAITHEPDMTLFDPPMVDTIVTYGYDLGTPGYFEYAKPFIANASLTPDPPVSVVNMTETGDTLVPLRSSLRSTTVWPEAMAAAGKRLYHRGYPGQIHAYCIIPQGGPCFMDIVNLLRNGTIPPLTPSAPAEHEPVPEVEALRRFF